MEYTYILYRLVHRRKKFTLCNRAPTLTRTKYVLLMGKTTLRKQHVLYTLHPGDSPFVDACPQGYTKYIHKKHTSENTGYFNVESC